MTTKTTDSRPLSPFMLGPYYRFQWTSVLSFGHRITGIGLSLGTALLAIWLIALAGGAQWYAAVATHVQAWYGQVLLFAWTWALMYHLGNGIRHLFWDIGRGFELKTAERSGYLVVVASLLLTAAAWALAYLA
ncbi:MAG: succinate dehydrogenase, cytochrome b556 subunit [Sinimarinibacterium flocculans]|uniref:Succinate dehydrogenase cytochrome b556 subunit n=1 Tax=Sinimarinibacterium flocculans TaxID=985250 RepID=A0A318EIX8_9GAMM|nr:succinate dehydrogenase, cytochrome b556 subunit [Sinimarinibacterium flocculans]MEC9363918.1 succinate dehydrogenase, cytochrome b556 subunit [Pseudomonadota bacterium]PXV71045.1 succinate dehydrogenase subunit C [Sinimarinibacterium flocculans]